tara:strand:- start:798 stop:1892 length:1095 start_codon:yes stop_codon:yes gene_type:complete
MAATSLDIDDGHRMAAGHPGAAIISSALATAQETKATIADTICSIVLGYQAAVSVALARYERYNNSTVSGRWSGIGASVARSKLLELSSSEISQSILIAEQHAPRVSSAMHHGFAGSDVKEGIAWSVLSGMYASDLSVLGFRGYPDTFEQNILYNPKVIKKSIKNFNAIHGLFFKPYACCRWIHSAIDGLLFIMNTNKLKSNDIKKIEVTTFNKAFDLGNHPNPKNEVEAQFSIPFCLAAVALEGLNSLTPLNNSLIGKSSISNFAKKVTIKKDSAMERMFPAKAPAIVKITHASGIDETLVDAAFGDPTNPMDRRDLQKKFKIFSKPIISEQRIALIIETLENFSKNGSRTPELLFDVIHSDD